MSCMPGRRHSPGRRKGKGNHLQFKTNLFTNGKIDRRWETLSSNPICISKIYLKHILMCYQWVHFPPLPCSSLHKATTAMLCTLWVSSSGPAWKCCFCLQTFKPPFCTHSPLRKYSSLLSWVGRTKTLSARISLSYSEKVTLNRQTLQSQPCFAME